MAAAGQAAYPRTSFPDARILVADRSFEGSELLASVLERGGYRHVLPVTRTTNLTQLVKDLEPHVLLLSLAAPGLSALGTLRQLTRTAGDKYRLVVVGSPSDDLMKHRAFEYGAAEYIELPFDPVELLHRLERQVWVQLLLGEKRGRWAELAKEVRSLTSLAERAQIETVSLLGSLIDELDPQLGEHSWRVARISGHIATAMGLEEKFVEDLRRAARLHDIGHVLMTASDRDDVRDERAAAETAATLGATFLFGAFSPLVNMAARIASTHRERWDGTGGPRGLRGGEIPLEGRIVAVADAYDNHRHGLEGVDANQSEPWPAPDIVAEVATGSGVAFDPDVVEALQATMPRKAAV